MPLKVVATPHEGTRQSVQERMGIARRSRQIPGGNATVGRNNRRALSERLEWPVSGRIRESRLRPPAVERLSFLPAVSPIAGSCRTVRKADREAQDSHELHGGRAHKWPCCAPEPARQAAHRI